MTVIASRVPSLTPQQAKALARKELAKRRKRGTLGALLVEPTAPARRIDPATVDVRWPVDAELVKTGARKEISTRLRGSKRQEERAARARSRGGRSGKNAANLKPDTPPVERIVAAAPTPVPVAAEVKREDKPVRFGSQINLFDEVAA